MRQRGFSIVELIVVIAVMSILFSIATLNWNEMQKKSAIESEIKKIHADLMEIRLQALYSKTDRSVVFSEQEYMIYASNDTSVAPLETKKLRYKITWNGGGALTFNAQGLTNNEGSLCVLPTNDTAVINSAAVDSIVVSQARINLGKRTEGSCNSDHIEPK